MTSNTKSLRLLQYDFQLNISGRSRFVDPVPLASTYAGKRAAVRSGRACLEKLEVRYRQDMGHNAFDLEQVPIWNLFEFRS